MTTTTTVSVKYIDSYDKRYSISSDGRVFSHYSRWDRREEPKELKPAKHSDGYHQVGLHKNGKQKFVTVHKLVAEAFIGPRPEGFHIDHIDRNKLNNNVSNLRYVTRSENNKNRPAQKNNKTGQKFISWNKSNNMFMVRVTINGKLKYFGSFKTEAEAIIRRDEVVQHYNAYV